MHQGQGTTYLFCIAILFLVGLVGGLCFCVKGVAKWKVEFSTAPSEFINALLR